MLPPGVAMYLILPDVTYEALDIITISLYLDHTIYLFYNKHL